MGIFSGLVREAAKKGESILAKDIVNDPDLIDLIPGKYVIVWDNGFNNLNKSLNMMAEKGWRCHSFAISGAGIGAAGYILMERMNR